MQVTMELQVAEELGIIHAVVVERIYELQPHYNKAKLNIQYVVTPGLVSRRTVHRVIKKLIDEGYFKRHSKSEYSFTIKFFETFPDYYVYNVKTI